MKKRAQGLSINIIIVAAIAIIILVVLIAIFTGRLGIFSGVLGDASKTCIEQEGTLMDNCDSDQEEIKSSDAPALNKKCCKAKS